MMMDFFKKTDRAKTLTSITAAVLIALVVYILVHPDFRFIYGFLRNEKLDAPILKVSYLYVGQGDCCIIRDLRPGGRVVMIDCGPSPEVAEYTAVAETDKTEYLERKVFPYLEKEGISKIDFFIASHKDGDHIASFPALIEKIPVLKVIDNGKDMDSKYAVAMMNAAQGKTTVQTAQLGDLLDFAGDITLQIIGPMKDYYNTESDDNNNSLVVWLAVGKMTFLFPGDCEIEAEMDMLSYGKALMTTVLKVPHHGSSSSSSNPFLDLIRPEVAVFSSGRNNRYGFPLFEIMRRYEDRRCRILRTDLSDNIEIQTDGKVYKIKKGRK